MYYDSETNSYIQKKDNKALIFLYSTFVGRLILKIAVSKWISNLYAKYMNSSLSKWKINRFIKKNHIKMDEYIDQHYHSFNDFFIRQIKNEKRPIEDNIISVCDAKLSVYEIDSNSCFKIKNSLYTVEELIEEKKNYKYALIFRLCVDDYHHYIFPDDGEITKRKHIDGKLHTVQPLAFKKFKVFHENSREVTFLNCKNLKDVCYIEVGALMVGKIINEDIIKFKKGEEKGHFEFGGSTIILLVNKDIKINKQIIENSKNNIETIVKLGQCIGK